MRNLIRQIPGSGFFCLWVQMMFVLLLKISSKMGMQMTLWANKKSRTMFVHSRTFNQTLDHLKRAARVFMSFRVVKMFIKIKRDRFSNQRFSKSFWVFQCKWDGAAAKEELKCYWFVLMTRYEINQYLYRTGTTVLHGLYWRGTLKACTLF